MTPPPAATTTAGRVGVARPAAPARVRDRTRRPGGAARAFPRPAIGRPSFAALRSFAIERLVGGRAWIVLLGGMLLGLVFLQVSLLQLNTQISTDIGRAAALERSNSEVRSTISHLAAGRRVQDVAQRLGMILPGAGALCYLDAARSRPCDGGRQPGTTAQAVDSSIVAATPPPGTTLAPATGTTSTTIPGAPATGTAPGATTQPAAGTTAPAGTAPGTTAPAATTQPQQPVVQQQAVQPPAGTTATPAPGPAAGAAGGQAAPTP